MPLGPRRGRHEGHGRDDPRRRPRPDAYRPQAARATSCSPSSPTRRPAAGSAPATWSRTTPTFRRLHRGDLRGRRFLLRVSDDLRLYLIETAQKGIAWMKLRAGRPGHGSMLAPDNAVTELARRSAGSAVTVPGPAPPDHAGVPRGCGGDRPPSTWRIRRPRSCTSARRPAGRRDHQPHRQPDQLQAGYKVNVSRAAPRPPRRPVPSRRRGRFRAARRDLGPRVSGNGYRRPGAGDDVRRRARRRMAAASRPRTRRRARPYPMSGGPTRSRSPASASAVSASPR